MEFIETSIFTKQVLKLLADSSYRILQSTLMLNPGAGAIIKGSGGIRKIRWNLPGAGKRGALRVIYIISINPKRFTCYSCTRKTNKKI